ncbi:MAG: energy transducer TonB [Pseudomonadota bacterium]
MMPRLVGSTAGATVMTAALLLFMQQLIYVRYVIPDIEPIKIRKFVREPVEEEPDRDPPPVRPPPPVEPPEVIQPELTLDPAEATAVSVMPPVGPVAPPITGPGSAWGDGGPLPIAKVSPIYPASALRRALEGFVIVEYTVTVTGAVRDPVVVESSNRVFNKSAIDAALRFKYRPRVIDGVAVETPGMMNRFTFELTNP